MWGSEARNDGARERSFSGVSLMGRNEAGGLSTISAAGVCVVVVSVCMFVNIVSLLGA